MLPEENKAKIDFSHASEKPTSITSSSQSTGQEELPDDHLPKNKEDENNSFDQSKNVVDDQIITANIHGG